jgi:hypothetical protein
LPDVGTRKFHLCVRGQVERVGEYRRQGVAAGACTRCG